MLLISITACDKVLVDDMTLKDVTGGNRERSDQPVVVDYAAIPNYVPCEPYTVDLIVHDDPLDLWGKTGIKVGTLTVTNDNSNLYLNFQLDPELSSNGCNITEISVLIKVWETYDGKWSPRQRKIKIDLSQNPASNYIVEVPKNYISNEFYPIQYDQSFECGDNLMITSYVKICCQSGGFGAGSQGQYYIDNGSYPMYYGNNDTYVGTLNVTIVNNNLVITYQTINNIGINDAHIHISTNCTYPGYPNNPQIGQFAYGSHKGQGQFSANNTIYTISIPLGDLQQIIGSIDLCDKEFCVLAHGALSNNETMFAGENKVSGSGRWYRYFKFTISCRPPLGGDPECFDAWSHGNGRICIVPNGLFPDRYWYFALIGYIYCCE